MMIEITASIDISNLWPFDRVSFQSPSQRRGSNGEAAPLAPLASQEPIDQLDGLQEGSEEDENSEDEEEEEEIQITSRSDSPRG